MVSTPERSQRSTRPGYSPPLSGLDDMSDDSDLAGLPEPSQANNTSTNTNANANTTNNTTNQDEPDEDFILIPRDSSPYTPAAAPPNRAASLSPMLQRDPLESALHPDTQWDVTPPSRRRAFQGVVGSPASPDSADGLSSMREDDPLSDVGPTITPPSLRRRQNMLVWDEAELSWVARRRRLSFVEEEEEDSGGLVERSGEEEGGSDGARDDAGGEREGRGDSENNVDITGAGQGVGGGCAC